MHMQICKNIYVYSKTKRVQSKLIFDVYVLLKIHMYIYICIYTHIHVILYRRHLVDANES